MADGGLPIAPHSAPWQHSGGKPQKTTKKNRKKTAEKDNGVSE